MPAAPPLYSTHCALQSRLLCTGDCFFLPDAWLLTFVRLPERHLDSIRSRIASSVQYTRTHPAEVGRSASRHTFMVSNELTKV